MNVERHDFGRPGKIGGELQQTLTSWLRVAVALACKKWAKVLPFKLTMTCKRTDAVRPAEALAQLPSPPVAVRVTLPCGTTTLFALPRPAVQSLAGGLLGDTSGAVQADAELTSVDAALLLYFMDEFLMPALEETSPMADPISLAVEHLEPHPQWSRAFMDAGNLVVCTFAMHGPFGELPCQWLLPARSLVSVLGDIAEEAQTLPVGLNVPAPDIAPLVHELPVEISVVLGTADVSLTQLARLAEGDMLILNQRVADPLSALIGGNEKFRGWAGRIGVTQAFQIQSLTDTN